MIIKSIAFSYFKGFADFTVNLNDKVTQVCGKNGTGKTTTGIAASWVMSGKDLDMKDEPEVRSLSHPECDSRVDMTCKVNDKKVVLTKYQTDMRTKKQKEANAPIRISNKFEINGVPKTAKDFYKVLEELGIDVENWLLLTNPDYLLSLKVADRRKVVFPLAGDVTDLDVAKSIEDCKELADKLMENTLEEIMYSAKAAVKRCKERQDTIPSEIAGMEKSKVEVDPNLPGEIEKVKAEMEELIAKRDDAKTKADAKSIDGRIHELRNRKTSMYNEANTERLTKYREAYAKCNDADDIVSEAKKELAKIESSGIGLNTSYKQSSDLYKRLSAELEEYKAEKYKGRTKCPTCGQTIPKADIEKAKANWQKGKDEKVNDTESRMRAIKTQIDSYKAEGKELAKQKKTAEEKLEEAKANLAKLQDECKKYAEPITPDFSAIDTEIQALNDDKEKCNEYAKKAYVLDDDVVEKQAELQALLRRKATEDVNDAIDKNIEEARESLKAYGQAKANAEKVLYQIQLVSMKKNEMLSDAVNSHFSRVKFRLFQTQKNGEVKDDCTPLVLCSDGEYRDMNYSANTAAIVMAKLDICAGLQKFYGQNLPIWLDGAECLDEENRKSLDMENQLILLCVTEDNKLTVR